MVGHAKNWQPVAKRIRVIVDNMDVRSRILQAAAALLAESSTGDISTRAVSEAAGVQQPVLYRQFGDKDSLLAAVVDYGFEQYLDSKRRAIKSVDPVDDLRSGWDSHTGFALEYPNFYRLMYSPSLRSTPEAAAETVRLLTEVLKRAAEQGRLRVPVETAAQMIMSANTGVALALISRPGLYPNPEISALVRDSVHQSILVDAVRTTSPEEARAIAATTLIGGLDALTPGGFTSGESGLLREWLARIAQTPASSSLENLVHPPEEKKKS
jgi:AcrR family transcriptional regulator